ncbi:carbon-nitrogen family hydrolase [Pseudonocardia acidicola]|uniref:Carbon-nitrogen family hydrolase n=1 Tax=Pseudonocardia acidicola TaxID=2724939 RepID=A0ABX1S5M2_9PSEU|nr:carbon-nitrogen family hydrolase [Pseudonocardia acidicola]NMH96878.1 carbon-nitrogen family hydrolase [Pseudonocardia acidicola]
MRIAAVQLRVSDLEPPPTRLEAARQAVRAEAARGAELVVLPEMWLPGFFAFDDYPRVAEPLDGPTATGLSKLAAECGVHLCAGSLVERSTEGSRRLHNTTTVFGPDGALLAAYRKIHLYGYGSREQELLTPGRDVLTCEIAGVRVGLSTCYDLRFPELYRAAAAEDAELFVVVAGWPFPRVDAWRCLARARAIENQAALVGCNAAGRQGSGVFAGASVAFNAWGTPLGELDDRPGILRVEIEPDDIRAARAEFPALRDRVL